MRILIATPVAKPREGGVANVVYNVEEELRGRGHQVTSLFREDVLPEGGGASRYEAVYFGTRLAKRIRHSADQFDVVLIHAPAGFAYGCLRRIHSSNSLPPYVMMLHGIEERRIHAMSREAKKGRAPYFKWRNRIWERVYHLPLYRFSIVTADQAIVINRETWSLVQLKYGLDAERVWYIPNGVEERFFLPREYSPGRGLRLLFAGTWLDHKGAFYLRDAFEELARRIPDLRLTISGCQIDAAYVSEWFSPELRNRVEVLPVVRAAEMPRLYARHDIFTFPSLMEGMPIVLLEAMATGMPVATTETCGMMDIVENEHNGLLVKPADTVAFIAAVERLIHSPELRENLGRRAQETMRRHTWHSVAQQTEHVLERAVANAKSGA